MTPFESGGASEVEVFRSHCIVKDKGGVISQRGILVSRGFVSQSAG